tara:strand:- start:110 stop:328 length:219 start_codon:yes stop_codon:yes gene_type:complete
VDDNDFIEEIIRNDSMNSSNDTKKASLQTNTEIEQIFINANKLAPWKEEETSPVPKGIGQIKQKEFGSRLKY